MKLLHELVALGFRITGLPWMLREYINRQKVTIVNYHNPQAERFAHHLEYFLKHYSIISLDTIVDAHQSGSWKNLPEKPLVITLDDGCRDNSNLLKIVRKHRIPLVIYVVAGAVGTNRKFWFNMVPRTFQNIKHLESVSNRERKQILEHTYSHTDEKEYPQGDGLTIEALRAFADNGVTIGSHTLSHPVLTRCDPGDLAQELSESRTSLSDLTGQDIRHFAYPVGYWNQAVKAAVAQAGYNTARTIDFGFVTSDSDLLSLPNLAISDDAGLNKAVVQASGIWDYLKRNKIKKRLYS